MKILNFTATEVLPALLDRSKTQTIRPAWHDRLAYGEDYEAVAKPARFKAGEKIKLMWKARGTPKNAMFCSGCGKMADKQERDVNEAVGWTGFVNTISPCGCCGHFKTTYLFPKILGIVVVTEVFQVRMWINQVECGDIFMKGKFLNRVSGKNLAEKEGFKSAEEMFEYFDSNYNLKVPKNFWLYRFRWG